MKVTLEQVKEIFANEVDSKVDVKGMDPNESLSDQGVDSLDNSSAFLALEDQFSVKFTDQDIEKLDSLNKIVDFINSHL